MKVVVDSAIHVPIEELPPKVFERIKLEFEFPNPEYHKRKRMRKWTGDLDETIRSYQITDWEKRLLLPRGGISKLKKICMEYGISLEFEDLRVSFPPIPLPHSIELRPYQGTAVDSLKRSLQGILVMPCGAGKTVTALKLVAELGQSTLILVHTKDLLEQWKSEIFKWFSIEPGEISSASITGFEHEHQRIVIGMVQTISRLPDTSFVELMDDFGCVIMDEAHHAIAFSFRRIIHNTHAKYRYGLTATPERTDGLTALLWDYVGPLLYQVTYDELQSGGYITAPTIENISTEFSYPYLEPVDYSPMMDALVSDRPRNFLILYRVLEHVKNGDCALVLSGRIKHCEMMCRAFNRKGLKAKLLIGKIKKQDRQKVIQEARSGEINVLVATTVADEGLNIPNLNHIFLIYPTRSASKVIQRVGRILRKYDGKSHATVHDFVDQQVPLLRNQAQARQRIYKETFPNSCNDGEINGRL